MKSVVKLSLTLITFIFLSFIIVQKNNDPIDKKYISIEKAIEKGLVSAKISGKGGHKGECIELNIESLIDNDTLVRIEPGRRLVSDDSTLQDILIIKEIQLFLAAREKKALSLFGFCCQATNGSPGKDAIFDIGFMEDSSIIILAEYLGKSGLPLGVMQSAVWVLSNNHSISSIHNDNENDRNKMKELYGLIAGIKGLEFKFPWYTLKYEQDTSLLFSNRPNKFFAEIDYNIAHSANVDLVIRDTLNRHVTNIFTNKPHHPNTYNYRFNLNVVQWPKGKYYLMLYVDNQMRLRKVFEL